MTEARKEDHGIPEPSRRPPVPDYELLRLIGSGSYGDVWLARGVTGIHRAVKVVWREGFADAEPFEREFRGLKEFAAISLQTAGQMALLHIGRNDAAGFFYYVMELADDAAGGREVDPATYVPLTLREWRARRGRIPAADVIAAGSELAEALAALHAHGLVHRDIKPSNAILVKGRAKLADIGLVTPAHEARTFIGTSGYVPPEGPGAPAADVFALGRMLYELATGLDREEFPRLPAELGGWPDRAELFELNEVLLRAGAARADARYPDARALAADLTALRQGRSLRARRNRRWLLSVAVAAAVITAGVFVASRSGTPPADSPAVAAPVSGRMIAVLPFENLMAGADDRYLVDGLAEEIRMALGRIEAFRVIGRTSVLAYADPRARRLPEIARELGVGAVVEGTVRQAGGRVRVAVQLTDPASGRQLWAESYERAVDELFSVQTGIAAEVARALHANLTPRERARVEELPSRNALAYSLYVRAKLRRSELDATHGESTLAEWDGVVRMLEEAVTADPGFAAAYALLSRVHAGIYFFSSLDASPARKERARQALVAAVRLAPDAPETWFAQGRFAYACERDFPEASRQFERAAAVRPNDGELLFSRGIVARRLGRLDEAVDLLTRALEVNPLDLGTAATLLQTLNMTGRYPEAVAVGERYTGTSMLHSEIAQLTSYSRFQVDGDVARYLETRRKAPLRGSDPHGLVRDWFAAVFGGDYEEAARIVSDPRFPTIAALDGVVPEPPALNRAYAARLLGRDAEAAAQAREAVAFYQQENWTPQQQWAVRVKLMEAATYGGDVAEAKRLAAEVRGGLTGADQVNDRNVRAVLWRVYAEIGETEEALAVLREIKRDGAAFSAHFARIDPAWRKLANDPRFDALLPLPPTSRMRVPRPAPSAPEPPPRPSASVAAEAQPRTIAVLPLEDFGGGAASDRFADGMHEQVLTSLGRIAALNVIARAAVRRYADPDARELRRIGEELGADVLIEGTVQRQGARMRVNLHLVEPRTSRQLWSHVYDHDTDDLFGVQAAIAADVAEALRVRLVAREQAVIARRPTANSRAYELYVQAKVRLGDFPSTADTPVADWEEVVRSLEEAVAMDPGFGAAHALLARVHAGMYFNATLDATPARKEKARTSLALAQRFAPDEPETRFAEGRFAYAAERNYPAAREFYREALQGLPNDAEVMSNLAYTERRLGNFSECTRILTRVLQGNPFDLNVAAVLVQNLRWTGRPAEAVAVGERFPGTTTQHAAVALDVLFCRYELDGEREALFSGLRALPPDPDDPEGRDLARFLAALSGDFTEALRLAREARNRVSSVLDGSLPATQSLACARFAFLAGLPEEAARHAEEARAFYLRGPWTPQQRPLITAPLMQAAVYAGRRDEALRLAAEIRRSIPSNDILNDGNRLQMLWQYYALLGAADEALECIMEMSRLGNPVQPRLARLSVGWKKLSGDPRFEEAVPLPPVQRL